ncbi:MAG: GTP-binding protein [Dysosmobacter sp.]
MADIPVYLIAGFLDGGKTDFINGILEDGFAREDKTLLICCEEGELEYEQKALDNVTVVTVDEETALTCSQCKEWEKQYKPKQVLIEYNGMWSMERLYREVLPANWVLYQVMTFVDANTFETLCQEHGPDDDGKNHQRRPAGVQPLHRRAGRPRCGSGTCGW